MKTLLLLVTLSLYACTTTPPMSAELSAELSKPLICSGDECKLMWDRAIYFVNTNSGYMLQIVNDNMIETYSSSDSNRLAFSIVKEPIGDGAYNIIVATWCTSLFGCNPHSLTTTARARRYIRSGML